VVVSDCRVQPFGVMLGQGGSYRVMDFASHRGFACAVWSGDIPRAGEGSIYRVDAHLRATARWTGLAAPIALPFGYSPTMLLLLGPLCLVSTRVAFLLWSVAGAAAITWFSLGRRVHWAALLPLVSPLAVGSIALGQTAILSTAALLFLMLGAGTGLASTGAAALVLWILTAKPPLAITAGAALLVTGRWRVVAAAAVITLVSTVAIRPWLGPGWIGDYLSLLTNYDQVRLPPAFAWSISPGLMSNLRAALHSDLGMSDDLAVELSTGVWLATLAALVVGLRTRRAEPPLVWSLVILAFLLFCPHVSATEDVALFCVLVALWALGLPAPVVFAASAMVAVGTVFSPAAGPLAGARPSLLFFVKLVLGAGILTAVLLGPRFATRR
jgi:glycosyl transferase family 87